jgi:hypothetical protein
MPLEGTYTIRRQRQITKFSFHFSPRQLLCLVQKRKGTVRDSRYGLEQDTASKLILTIISFLLDKLFLIVKDRFNSIKKNSPIHLKPLLTLL